MSVVWKWPLIVSNYYFQWFHIYVSACFVVLLFARYEPQASGITTSHPTFSPFFLIFFHLLHSRKPTWSPKLWPKHVFRCCRQAQYQVETGRHALESGYLHTSQVRADFYSKSPDSILTFWWHFFSPFSRAGDTGKKNCPRKGTVTPFSISMLTSFPKLLKTHPMRSTRPVSGSFRSISDRQALVSCLRFLKKVNGALIVRIVSGSTTHPAALPPTIQSLLWLPHTPCTRRPTLLQRMLFRLHFFRSYYILYRLRLRRLLDWTSWKACTPHSNMSRNYGVYTSSPIRCCTLSWTACIILISSFSEHARFSCTCGRCEFFARTIWCLKWHFYRLLATNAVFLLAYGATSLLRWSLTIWYTNSYGENSR